MCLLEHADAPVVRLGAVPGRTGLWDRLERLRSQLPLSGRSSIDELPSMLDAAGLDVVTDRVLVAQHRDATCPALRTYAVSQVRGLLTGLADRLAPEDRSALETLRAVATPRRHASSSLDASRTAAQPRRGMSFIART